MNRSDTLLLAEPDEALAASLGFALRIQGYHVETVDPDRLDRSIGDDASCLIIGDRPRTTEGLQAALRLRRAGASLPILLLSTNPSRATLEQARRHDVVLVEKPLMGRALEDALNRIGQRPLHQSASPDHAVAGRSGP